MSSALLKQVAGLLPRDTQDALKRRHFRSQINAGTFIPDEPEILALPDLLSPGDACIDVGANVGHYTLAMSRQVGSTGRVIAFEPMLESFDILTANIRASHATNITLLNLAASNSNGIVAMSLPGNNFYRAHISATGDHHVMSTMLDSLTLPKIRLIKIDAEDHDLAVLQGAEKLISRDRPILIVESGEAGPIPQWLHDHGYTVSHFTGSPNVVARPLI